VTGILDGIISFVGIGSNLENPVARCNDAVKLISDIRDSILLRRSSFYRTEPVGFREQDWFINAVVEIKTVLTAQQLMIELQKIEILIGRLREVKWGPRIIDLDILLYGQEVIREDLLIVPHPELHKRRFALAPLYEIAPYAIHPAFGVSVAGLMTRLEDGNKVELIKEE
jgi:2-amino-4-hydroxy-6-hydroxymethyldihydropteridine diphosphokinase